MIFEPEFETMPRDRLGELQSGRLTDVVGRLYEQVPLYRERLDEVGVRPADVRSIEDITKLPMTRKEDLRQTYPFGMFAVERSDLVRIHASTGTTGKPTVVGYTRDDVDLFARVNARCLAMAGAEPGMMLHNAYGYGLFTGGLGLHNGGERLGMTVVPVSGGMTERQVMLIRDFGPDVICCTPSYALTLAQEFRDRGIAAEELSMRFALLGAEPWTEPMRAEIDAALGVTSTNIYGLSEVIGPGVSNECVEARAGSHINEDHFLPEVVDPDSGEPVGEGEEGVLLFTTLTKQALPLLRYWTGDITRLSYDECECRRTLARMDLIKGRADDMLIIRGVNVYPTQVEDVLGRVQELSPHYTLVVSRTGTLDELEIQAEVSPTFFEQIGIDVLSEETVETDQRLHALRERVKELVKQTVGVAASVRLLPPGAAPRSEGGKLKRVVDARAV